MTDKDGRLLRLDDKVIVLGCIRGLIVDFAIDNGEEVAIVMSKLGRGTYYWEEIKKEKDA